MFDDDNVKTFIRDILGCSCPDEVFEEVSIQPVSYEIGKVNINFQIKIGGRLLIFVCRTDDAHAVSESLKEIFQKGISIRNNHRFNRFRFVVATSNEDLAREMIIPVFQNLDDIDENTHLHIIHSKELPNLFHRL